MKRNKMNAKSLKVNKVNRKASAYSLKRPFKYQAVRQGDLSVVQAEFVDLNKTRAVFEHGKHSVTCQGVLYPAALVDAVRGASVERDS